VTLLVDANALFAQADRRSGPHLAIVEVLRAEGGPLVAPAFVAQEADYMIQRRLGVDAELGFLRDLAEGTYLVETLTFGEFGLAMDLIERYRDLRLGLADASLVLLAERFDTTRILTLDYRHFRAVAPLKGGHFTLLPADT